MVSSGAMAEVGQNIAPMGHSTWQRHGETEEDTTDSTAVMHGVKGGQKGARDEEAAVAGLRLDGGEATAGEARRGRVRELRCPPTITGTRLVSGLGARR